MYLPLNPHRPLQGENGRYPTPGKGMSLPLSHRSAARGSTLIVTICITAIIGVGLMAYLQLVSSQNQLVARSQAWNSCMPILEAGIEEALTHSKKNYVTNMASNGWSLEGTNYVKTNSLGDGYYQVQISDALPYSITSWGYFPVPGNSAYVSRTVKVVTQNQGVFSGALVVRNTVNLNGNDVKTDSFDSRDPLKSTLGLYDPLKPGDKGDIVSAQGLVDSVSIGNANVWGRVLTGPAATISVGKNGAVGSVNWQQTGKSGIEPGWSSSDLNISFPDIKAPFVAAVPPAANTVNGTYYDYVLGNGPFQSANLGGKVLVTGDAVLYVTGQINFGGSDSLQIAPGASLKIYMAGASTDFNTVINPNSNAKSFFYYGLPTNTRITMSGNSQFTGAIYAPQADFKMMGGVQLYGSLVANSATLTGHSQFHYDEALLDGLPSRGFVIVSWNEI